MAFRTQHVQRPVGDKLSQKTKVMINGLSFVLLYFKFPNKELGIIWKKVFMT